MPGEGTGTGWHGNVRYLKFKRRVGRGDGVSPEFVGVFFWPLRFWGNWACKSCAQKFGSAMLGEGTGTGWHGNVRYLKFKRRVGRGYGVSPEFVGGFCLAFEVLGEVGMQILRSEIR